MISFQILLQISIICACFGFCWVCLLTEPRGIFEKTTQYYPKLPQFLQHVLQCVPCLSGWIATGCTLIVGVVSIWGTASAAGVGLLMLDILQACLLSMTIGKLIQVFSER